MEKIVSNTGQGFKKKITFVTRRYWRHRIDAYKVGQVETKGALERPLKKTTVKEKLERILRSEES